jgi:hypothetical protein
MAGIIWRWNVLERDAFALYYIEQSRMPLGGIAPAIPPNGIRLSSGDFDSADRREHAVSPINRHPYWGMGICLRSASS